MTASQKTKLRSVLRGFFYADQLVDDDVVPFERDDPRPLTLSSVLDDLRSLAEGGCCCEDDPGDALNGPMGLKSDAPETWCYRCMASAAVDEIEGREPGSTVLAERSAADAYDRSRA